MGKILRVDLSKGKISESSLAEELIERFLGGYGIGAKLLYDEVGPNVAPFDPDNRLIFCTGPVTGTIAPSSARYAVVAKSPSTGFYGDASSGGNWGPELKFSGYDFLIIQGRSAKPVYLFVQDGKAELKDANHLWGLDARETDRRIVKDLGDKGIRVACIGQAGENLVKFASIMNDDAGRAAARCGVGAVMGSKKLKAVAVRGHKKVPVADNEALRKIALQIIDHYKSDNKKWFSKAGTPGIFSMLWPLGDIPAYNWGGGPDSDYPPEKVATPGGYDNILSGTRSCFACTLGCRRMASVAEGPYSFEDKVEGPEYETLAAFGPNCGVSEIKAIAKANDLCNLYGLDTISAGSTIAFAMECYENGLITRKETEGMELKFGNHDAVLELLHKIAKREGFGDTLAEGVKGASKKIGKNADEYAIQVKGLELAMHEPRAFQGVGTHYATTITGGKHTEGMPLGFENGRLAPELGITKLLDRFTTEGKGELTKLSQDWTQTYSAMGFCMFGDLHYAQKQNLIDIYNAVTGDKMTIHEALKVGDKLFNLKKLFNLRHGAMRADDQLPKRLLNQPKMVAKDMRMVSKVEETLPQYYRARGWDPETSKPTKQKLEELGLIDAAKTAGY